jgi:hypothetical protein
MAVSWWFVVFCLLVPVQVGLLVRVVVIERRTYRHLAGLRQEAVALRDMAAAMQQVMVLQLALWRISWRQR